MGPLIIQIKLFLFSKIFHESLPLPTLTNSRKAIWRYLLSIQNEAISLVNMRSNGLWLVQENHTTVKLDFSVASRRMKTYNESRFELRNLQILKKKSWISQVSFCHQSSPVSRKAWMLPCCRSWKNTPGLKTCDCGQSGGHSIRVLNGKERQWRWKFVFSVVDDSQISLK